MKQFDGKEMGEQDLSKHPDKSVMFLMWLLFEGKPVRPSVNEIKQALENKFGEVDIVSEREELSSFAIKKYNCEFKEGILPAQVVHSNTMEFTQDTISEFERYQLWNVPDADDLLSRCTHKVLVSDMMSAVMEHKLRGEFLMDWLETAVALYPECIGVWIPSAGKLFEAEQIREHQIPRKDRFVYFGVNARFFNIQGSEDKVVDTLGMGSMGLPDVQYHFHDLNPNDVVNHAYNVASYIYDGQRPIDDGETIDGLDHGEISRNVQWKCRYEEALIQPQRPVIDICPGEFAAGERE